MTNEVIHVASFKAPIELGSLRFRGIRINGEPWVVAPDVCRVLGWPVGTAEHGGATQHLRGLGADEKMTVRRTEGIFLPLFEGTRASSLTLISESGLWKLILRAHPDRSPAVRRTQEWLTREVLPALRKDGMYVMGEEKVRTGEMSEDEMTLIVLTRLKNKVERITAERDQLRVENVEVRRVNTALTIELTMVTIQEWKALNHVYLEACDTNRIAAKARDLANARGIKLTKVDRDVPIGGGMTIRSKVNVYPRELLDEAAAALGFNFMLKLPV